MNDEAGSSPTTPPPGQERLDAPRVSLVLPAYREVERIAATVDRVRSELGESVGPAGLEIVVVDDGSGDGTAAAARRADLVVELPVNRGKGAAVRTGVLAASGATIAFTDADLSYSPAQVMNLVEAVEGGVAVAIGNRYDASTTTVVAPSKLREAGGRLINAATRLVLAGDYPDTQCGLKAFDGSVARSIFSRTRIDGFAFDVEVLAIAERDGETIAQLPVEVVNSEASTVRVARDALRLLRDLASIRRTAAKGGYQ